MHECTRRASLMYLCDVTDGARDRARARHVRSRTHKQSNSEPAIGCPCVRVCVSIVRNRLHTKPHGTPAPHQQWWRSHVCRTCVIDWNRQLMRRGNIACSAACARGCAGYGNLGQCVGHNARRQRGSGGWRAKIVISDKASVLRSTRKLCIVWWTFRLTRSAGNLLFFF